MWLRLHLLLLVCLTRSQHAVEGSVVIELHEVPSLVILALATALHGPFANHLDRLLRASEV